MKPDQVAQGFIQLGLENLQGQRLHEQFHLLTLLTACQFFFYDQLGPPLFQLMPAVTCPPSMHRCGFLGTVMATAYPEHPASPRRAPVPR